MPFCIRTVHFLFLFFPRKKEQTARLSLSAKKKILSKQPKVTLSRLVFFLEKLKGHGEFHCLRIWNRVFLWCSKPSLSCVWRCMMPRKQKTNWYLWHNCPVYASDLSVEINVASGNKQQWINTLKFHWFVFGFGSQLYICSNVFKFIYKSQLVHSVCTDL